MKFRIYDIKLRLQSYLDKPPEIATLAIESDMSEPKMRKLFKQTFVKDVLNITSLQECWKLRYC